MNFSVVMFLIPGPKNTERYCPLNRREVLCYNVQKLGAFSELEILSGMMKKSTKNQSILHSIPCIISRNNIRKLPGS